MAKQLNLLETGQIIPTALHTEMERSYLEYAMSVIVGRALPDVRDGLKPVHRRILYAMHELGLTPDRPYRKCARVVGDVLGKYHPHGDQSVYDALVRMVQEFSSRYPLLAGHGNFGSVDNDPPAAMRYTETRLAAIAHESMLGEIGEATVDYGNNFDNSQQEPVVLPAQLPLLLLNGCTGIAVGMATNVPPHNLRELVDGLIALIDKPDLPDEKLWKLIPGPDFPTGGEIVGTKGVREAYQTGRGIMTMRGVARIEKVQGGTKRRREKAAIVVTELPYQVNKAGWIEKVADLVNQGRMEGISDIRDESDRDGMRVVIETKRDANPREVLRQLYKQSALQSNFGAILLTLVDNKPCQLSLREVLEEFLKFREQTLVRLYTYNLEEAQRRQHLIAGLLAALNNLDLTIDILRHAPDGSTAKVSLQEGLGISESQADSILAMPMRRLTGLEKQKLETEARELEEKIAGLELLLRDRTEFLKSLKKDLRTLKRKFGDDRRTRIVTEEAVKGGEKKKEKGKKKEEKAPILSTENLFTIPDDAVLEVTRKGGICWQSPPSKPKAVKKPEDLLLCREAIAGRKELVVVTDSGKAYPLMVGDVPASGGKATPIVKFLPSSVKNKRESIFSCFFVPQDLNQNFLVIMTQNGRIKRLAGAEVDGLTNRGSLLIKFKEDDCLNYLGWAKEGDEMAIATSAGRVLRLNVDDEQLPVMGRNTLGNQATRVRVKEEIIGGVTLPPDRDLLIVTQQGYAKRIPLNIIRKVNRGDIGTQVMQFVDKSDRLVGIMVAPPENQRFVAISQTQRLLYVPVKSVQLWGKDGVGDRIFQLKENETIVEIARR